MESSKALRPIEQRTVLFYGDELTAVLMDDGAERRYGDLLQETGLVRVFDGGGATVWRWPDGA